MPHRGLRIFLDPLYSSGLDLVAIGNGLISDMITRELDGEDVGCAGRGQRLPVPVPDRHVTATVLQSVHI